MEPTFFRHKDRQEAGRELAKALAPYRGTDAVVYALPRGGVELGIEAARALNVPLDLLIPRKIAHPNAPEYAVAAVTETGVPVFGAEGTAVEREPWFTKELAEQRAEAKRRRERYLSGRPAPSAAGKTMIIVDDGAATGLTMRAAIAEARLRKPAQVVAAVPVLPADTLNILEREADRVVFLHAPKFYLGSVGAYYDEFPQVPDERVIELLNAALPTV